LLVYDIEKIIYVFSVQTLKNFCKIDEEIMPEKVIVLGAGIGGMTVAHELAHCKEKKYEIHVYERHDTLGGMARSSFKNRNNIKLPTEYCWRVYGPHYDNLRQIFKQIPININTNKTVFDNLVNINEYLIADKNKILKMTNRLKMFFDMRDAFKNISIREKFSVLSKIFYCFMISTKRLNTMDSITWNDYINPQNTLCHDMRKYIVDMIGPYFGVDSIKANVPSVVKTLESLKLFNKPLSVLEAPTNEAWFEPWKTYLLTKGVSFHLNAQVTDIQTEGDKVTKALLADGREIYGHHFFCGMSVESVAKMPSLHIPEIVQLAKLGYQLMMTIQLYFNKRPSLPLKHTVLYIPDSPWQLVIEPEGAIWNRSYGDVAGIWSIGLCESTRPGLLVKKPFVECSHEEIQREVWYQINISEFGKYLNLSSIQILDYNVWDSYVFNGSKLETYEPKFSPNKGTWRLRPNNETKYKNFYFATAYTKTDTDMFEMEGAAESGRRAAQMLDKSVKIINSYRPAFFAPFRWIDSLLPQFDIYKSFPLLSFCLGLPMLVFLPFVYLYRYFFKRNF
jgi:hypothetical protein